MAANVLTNHNQNPYKTDKRETNLVLFTVSGHDTYLLPRLPTIELRVIMVLASQLNPSGYACASLNHLSHYLGMSESYVNQGLKGLASRDYITKKKRGEYWINPKLFRPALIERY